MKTSAGALNFISISKVCDLSKTIDNLKKSGLQIVATYEKASETYTNIDLTIPTAIIIGSEEDGIAPALLKKADREVKIPIIGRTASLNASVAAAIIIYEAIRHRTKQ